MVLLFPDVVIFHAHGMAYTLDEDPGSEWHTGVGRADLECANPSSGPNTPMGKRRPLHWLTRCPRAYILTPSTDLSQSVETRPRPRKVSLFRASSGAYLTRKPMLTTGENVVDHLLWTTYVMGNRKKKSVGHCAGNSSLKSSAHLIPRV
jgi:hypothetical protein